MTDDYTPLTDEEFEARLRAWENSRHPSAPTWIVDYARYWKRRAEEAEEAERVDKCHKCHGRGWLLYPKTTTYMHGVGGNVMTKDVCEVCWGSGDERNPFRNLREVMQAWGDAERRARAPQ